MTPFLFLSFLILHDMRIHITILFCLIISSCQAQNPPSLSKEQAARQVEPSELTELSYKRQTRGYNSLMTINPKTIVIYNSNGKSESYTYPNREWDSIRYLVQKIEVSKLPYLKAPTDKRLYDGAAAATLTLVKDKTAYSSSTFDDGYPPREISDLVIKLLALEKAAINN